MKKNLIGLIDADFIKYLVIYDIEQLYKRGMKLDKLITVNRINSLTQNRIRDIQSNTTMYTKSLIFLFSGKTENNFRSKIAVTKKYKGTRKYEEKILNEAECRNQVEEYIKSNYEYHKEEDLEADDLCTMGQQHPYTFIYSNDKDLRNYPGYHFDIKSKKMVEVSSKDGFRSLLQQAMQGDSVDNIAGAHLIGKVKAKRIIDKTSTAKEAITATINTFLATRGDFKDNFDRFIEMYSLVNLRSGTAKWEREKYKNYFNKIDRLLGFEEEDLLDSDINDMF